MRGNGIPKEFQKYIQPVRNDMKREIGKRGVISHRKDKNGEIRKTKNKNGTSSPFGFGTVDSTLPLIRHDLIFTRSNLDLLIKQIRRNESILEKRPAQPQKKRAKIDLTPAPVKEGDIRVPPLLQAWYADTKRFVETGSIGLAPECWSEGVPPIQEYLQSNAGQIMLNFVSFFRRQVS